LGLSIYLFIGFINLFIVYFIISSMLREAEEQGIYKLLKQEYGGGKKQFVYEERVSEHKSCPVWDTDVPSTMRDTAILCFWSLMKALI